LSRYRVPETSEAASLQPPTSENSSSTTFVNRRLQINPIEHRSRTNT
jgi:hypothetical protein